MDKITLGDKLRSLRISKNLTIKEVTEASGITAPTISHIEYGRHTPRLDTFVILCRFYGADPAEMLKYVDC